MSQKKDILDEFADHLIQGMTRGAAKGVAAVFRHAKERLTQPLKRAEEGFEDIANCSCTPSVHRLEGPDGEVKTIVMHAKGCAVR